MLIPPPGAPPPGLPNRAGCRVVLVDPDRRRSRLLRLTAHLVPGLEGQGVLEGRDQWRLVRPLVQRGHDVGLVALRRVEALRTKLQDLVDQVGELSATRTRVVLRGDDRDRLVGRHRSRGVSAGGRIRGGHGFGVGQAHTGHQARGQRTAGHRANGGAPPARVPAGLRCHRTSMRSLARPNAAVCRKREPNSAPPARHGLTHHRSR